MFVRKMPSKERNIVRIIQKRERGTSARFTSNIELQKVAEERAALAEMQEIHCKLPGSVRSTFLTSFSPDSTKVASTHGDHKIYVCDVKTGKLLHKLEGHPRTPWCLAFHPTSNDILASGCLGGEVRVWHLHGGSEKWRAYHNTVITSLAFHPLDKVLVIATFNEIHFWDWSLAEPFASCSTNSINEKVRFVKFDQLGNRLITGILNLQEVHRGTPPGETTRNQPRSTETQAGISHRRSLLSRLMNMYQHIEGMDELTRLTEGLGQAQEEALNQARQYAEATTQATRLQRQLHESFPANQVPLEPSARPQVFGSASEGASDSREMLDSHEEFLVRAFWRTFYRLRSICTTLERRMFQLQRHSAPHSTRHEQRPSTPTPGDRSSFSGVPVIDRIRNATNDVATNTRASYRQVTSSYLINVLTRLQNSLQFSSLTNAVAQEQIQQLQFRISEILDRLTNVTGYRARLTTLRDQIFEVAERTERRGGDSASSRRLDLAHCLWLVEMSLQLTQQMQRILQADYRLTQLHINSSSRRSTLRPSSSSSSPTSSGGVASTSNSNSSSSSSSSDSPTPGSSRSCIACGNQNPAADAGSSEEFDQAWDRLRVVVRRELETLTERFRSNLFNDMIPSQSNDAQPESLPSSSWQSVLMPLPEHPILQRTTADSEDNPSHVSRLQDDLDGRRGNTSSQQRGTWRSLYANSSRNARSTSVPSSRTLSGQTSNFFVPEIHVVPSASEEDAPNLLPVHERPRSPPLPTILSGSTDPLLNTWFQTIYDAGTRNRFGGETNNAFLHRIQCWDFSKYEIPSINNAKANVVVRRCKIHNDASVDISKDGEMLVALLPSASSMAVGSLVFAVFSLKPSDLGQLLLMSDFDCNAISVSFSPLNQFIVVGLATSRMYLTSNEKQAVAQIFELKFLGNSLVYNHVRNLTQDGIAGVNNQSVSLNSVQWLPEPGQGLIYGTNRGCLCICKPISPMNGKVNNNLHLGLRPRHSLFSLHRMFSASTQTSEPEMHTTGTQTFGEGSSATSR